VFKILKTLAGKFMKTKKGFTLIELLVVVLIISILAGLIMINYSKVVEESRARNSVKILRMLGAARRMQLMENGNAITTNTRITNAMITGVTCPTSIANINQIGHLHACGYGDLANVNWNTMASFYEFFSCATGAGTGCCAGAPTNTIACTRRTAGGPTLSQGWKYYYTSDGQCSAGTGTVPPCIE
jgi:prepilin-type N-terminal cleavage/methylation domain-containing protein